MTRTLAALLFALAAACGAKTPPAATQPLETPIAADRDAGVGQTTTATGAGPSGGAATTCKSNADCGAGEMCSGGEGCDVAWTCVPARPCTRDMVIFCGCDGQELRGSGSCPPGPYKHKGACP